MRTRLAKRVQTALDQAGTPIQALDVPVPDRAASRWFEQRAGRVPNPPRGPLVDCQVSAAISVAALEHRTVSLVDESGRRREADIGG